MYDDEIRSRRHYDARAPLYDWANRLAALVRGTSAKRERSKAIAKLGLAPGLRVLEVCVGTGTNLPLIRDRLAPGGTFVGLDISRNMLVRCHRHPFGRVAVTLVEGEAAHLPFADQSFDAVLQHGGLAEFGDRRGAIAEMARVARPAAKVVICDVGVPENGRVSLLNRWLLKLQPEYEKPPPLDLLPASAQDVSLTWIARGSWYLLDFVNRPG